MFDSGNGALRRFRRLSPEKRHLLWEAAGTLLLVSGALHLLPFRRAIRLGSVDLAPVRRGSSVEDIIWAVEAAARRVPWRTVCLQKGLCAQRMLRGAGVDASLNYGIRNAVTGKLEAHVWVTVGGRPVIGGEEADGFARVASYPQSQALAG
jgi:hypothetical protein